MLHKKYFIFEAFRIKHCVAREASYNSLNVLKDIERPCRVKLYIGFAAQWEYTVYILQGLFCHHQEHTSALPVVGSGKYFHHFFTDMFTTSVRNRTTTANDMTAGTGLIEAIVSFISLSWGIIGGNNFTPSLLSFTQFWLVSLYLANFIL